jgi:hypothetical protein
MKSEAGPIILLCSESTRIAAVNIAGPSLGSTAESYKYGRGNGWTATLFISRRGYPKSTVSVERSEGLNLDMNVWGFCEEGK